MSFVWPWGTAMITSGLVTTPAANETTTITGLVPAIATADKVWPGGSYPVGAGPDRTPNTFGAFALDVSTAQAAAPPPPAPAPAPVQQPASPAGAGSPARVAAPKVRCRPTRTKARRPRTTCTIRVAASAVRIVVAIQGRRLASVKVVDGRATVLLPRRRRTFTFTALDAQGRRIARRMQTVGG